MAKRQLTIAEEVTAASKKAKRAGSTLECLPDPDLATLPESFESEPVAASQAPVQVQSRCDHEQEDIHAQEKASTSSATSNSAIDLNAHVIIMEYPKAVACQLCFQPYTDPRTLTCFHSFCRPCLLKEVARQSGKRVQMNGSRQGSDVEKGSQPDELVNRSPGQHDDLLEKESNDSESQEGPQDVDSEEVSQSDGLAKGSKHVDLEKESQDSESHERPQDVDSEGVKCPTCKIPAFIPRGGISELPQNFHLGFEAKVTQCQLKIARAHEVPCDACIDGSSGPSVGFCCQCLQFLCQPCCEHHKRNHILHCHTVVTLGIEVTREQLFPNKPVPSCSLHIGKKWNLYCAMCECLVCEECVTTAAHKDHTESITIPQTAGSSKRAIIGKWIEDVKTRMQELSAAINVNREVLKKVETAKEKANEVIEQEFKRLHSGLEERKQQLQTELHRIVLCKTTSLELQCEGFEKLLQDANRCLEFASDLSEAGTDHELIAMTQMPSAQLEALFERMDPKHLVPSEHSDLTADFGTKSIINKPLDVGKIIDFHPSPEESIWEPISSAIVNTEYNLKVELKDSKRQPYPHGGIQIDVRAELRPNAIDQVTSYGKSEKDKDGNYTIALIPQTVGPHKLHITMDGQHIKNSPYDLEVRKSKLDYSAGLGNPVLNISVTSPLSIAINKDSGYIYVGSEGNCVFVFNKDGVHKNTIGSAGHGLCQFNRPCGLAIKRNVLFVADCSNHRIQKLDLRGTFAYAFGRRGQKDGEFNSPIAVVVDFNDRLIVADQGNHRIQVMTLDGTFLMSIHQSESLKLDFSNICGIALDVQGNIHVAKIYDNSGWINVFTSGGAFVTKHKISVKPAAIGIDMEGYTLVCDAETKSVHVYDVTGHKCGMAIENLGNPKGIVLDKDSLYMVHSNYLQKYSLSS